MNASHSPEDALTSASREEVLSALFANMVVQHTNMAMMFLGRVPHPETGEHVFDLDTAQMFIDQLEMLETKTKGNLNKQEEGLLKQGLAATRMAFFEAVEHGGKPQSGPSPAKPSAPQPAPSSAQPASAETKPGEPPVASAPAEDHESRKKFTKKY